MLTEWLDQVWNVTYAIVLGGVIASVAWMAYRRGYWSGHNAGYTEGVADAKGWSSKKGGR